MDGLDRDKAQSQIFKLFWRLLVLGSLTAVFTVSIHLFFVETIVFLAEIMVITNGHMVITNGHNNVFLLM